MATHGKYSGPSLTLAQRRYTAMKLRQQGFDFYQVAEEMKVRFPELAGVEPSGDDPGSPSYNPGSPGYDALAAWNDVNQMLANIREEMQESIPDVIMLESQRLDEMTRSLWPKVAAGRERSIELVLRIQERRARMLGLDSAIQVDWKVEIADMYEAGVLTLEEVKTNLGEELFSVFTRYVEERKLSARKSSDPLLGLKKGVAKTGDETLALFTKEGTFEHEEMLAGLTPMKPVFEGRL